VNPENEALLGMDPRKLESQELRDKAEDAMERKRAAAKTKRPAPPPQRAPADATVAPLQARLAEKQAVRDASRNAVQQAAMATRAAAAASLSTVSFAQADTMLGGATAKPGLPVVVPSIDASILPTLKASVAPVHPTDPLPVCLELEPRSMMLVDEVIIRVSYNSDQGFRNEMMAVPVTATVAELGTMVTRHCGLESPKFMYTPNGQGRCQWALCGRCPVRYCSARARSAGKHRRRCDACGA
jgi:hypothetical protein